MRKFLKGHAEFKGGSLKLGSRYIYKLLEQIQQRGKDGGEGREGWRGGEARMEGRGGKD